MADTQAGSVVFLSGDLMFASRVRAAAENAGLTFLLGANLPETGDATVRYVVLDLATRGSLTESIAADCAERFPEAKLVAYGPHVQANKLAAAKESGIAAVMTRGQFDRQLTSLFTR